MKFAIRPALFVLALCATGVGASAYAQEEGGDSGVAETIVDTVIDAASNGIPNPATVVVEILLEPTELAPADCSAGRCGGWDPAAPPEPPEREFVGPPEREFVGPPEPSEPPERPERPSRED